MPTLRGSATSSAGSWGTGRTIARPTGLQESDLVLICISGPNLNADPEYTVSGFDTVFQAFDNQPGDFTNLTILAGTGAGSGAFAVSSSVVDSGAWVTLACVAYADADHDLIVGSDAVIAPAGSMPVTVPAITTTEDDSVILFVGTQMWAQYQSSTPSFTQLYQGDLFVRARDQEDAGSTGTVSLTMGSVWEQVLAVQIGIQPTQGATSPEQVTGLTATPGNEQVLLEWGAPDDGGEPITDYAIETRDPPLLYEEWLGDSGDPIPSERWDEYQDVGVIEQTGDGYLSMQHGDTGAWVAEDHVVVRSSQAFTGSADLTIRWQLTAGHAMSLGLAWCDQSTDVWTGGWVPSYPPNGYHLFFDITNSVMQIFKDVSGTPTPISDQVSVAQAGLTPVAPNVVWNFRVMADGANVSVWISDENDPLPSVPTISASDSDWSSGRLRIATIAGPEGAFEVGPVTIREEGIWEDIPHTPSDDTEYLHTGLTNDTPYFYRVAAINSVGLGAYSDPVSATPVSDGLPSGDYLRTGEGILRGPGGGLIRRSTVEWLEAPGAINNLAATPGDTEVSLEWSPPFGGSDPQSMTYGVYQRDAQGSEEDVGPYTVQNGKIYDPNGNEFYPFGANAAIKITSWPYVFEHSGNLGSINSLESDPVTFPDHIAEAKTWGWNFIRVNCLVINNDPGGPNPDDPALYADLIEHGVNELLDEGFVVMLASHDATGANPTSGSSVDLALKEFFEAVVEKWGDNPNLWLNPYNEPYADDTPELIEDWVELHEDWIDFLRGEGYTGPIICDIPGWAQNMGNLADGTLDDFAEYDPGIIFGWHAYGWVNPWRPDDQNPDNSFQSHEDYAAAAKARGHCILIGEFGVMNPPETEGPLMNTEIGFNWAIDRAQYYDIGLVWWHSVHNDGFDLLSNSLPYWESLDGTGLTDSGEEYWDRGQLLDNPAEVTPWVGLWQLVEDEVAETEFVVEELENEVEYDFSIIATNSVGEGPRSNIVTATPVAPPVSIDVTPASVDLYRFETQQFTATANWSDSSTSDVTATANWSVNNTNFATITGTGLATAVAEGAATATVTAEYDGETDTATVNVQAGSPPEGSWPAGDDLDGWITTGDVIFEVVGGNARFRSPGSMNYSRALTEFDGVAGVARSMTVSFDRASIAEGGAQGPRGVRYWGFILNADANGDDGVRVLWADTWASTNDSPSSQALPTIGDSTSHNDGNGTVSEVGTNASVPGWGDPGEHTVTVELVVTGSASNTVNVYLDGVLRYTRSIASSLGIGRYCGFCGDSDVTASIANQLGYFEFTDLVIEDL